MSPLEDQLFQEVLFVSIHFFFKMKWCFILAVYELSRGACGTLILWNQMSKSGSPTGVAQLSAGLSLEKLNVKCLQILLT